jgi:hypothetical protein
MKDLRPEDFPVSGRAWAALRKALHEADTLCQVANAKPSAISDAVKLRVLPGSAAQLRDHLARVMHELDQLPDVWNPGNGDTL